jgi:hypothetical protein
MSTDLIAQLNNTSIQINRYSSVALFLFGTIGNALSCLVFSQKQFRSNPCVVYFLTASISNIISIISGLPPRMLRDWNIIPDLTETIPILCKFRLFILFTTRTIASWLLVCATIDRYLVSSTQTNLRRLSNMKQAIYWIIFVSILSFIFWSEILYCFDANSVNTPIKCYAKSNTCRIFNDLSQALVTTIIPSVIMLMFGLATIANIHQSQLVNPVIISRSKSAPVRNRKTDNSLTRMLFLQVILLTIFNIPQAIQKLHITNTFDQFKSPVDKAIQKFLFGIVVLSTYIPHCLPFYLYTYTGSVFRETLFKLFRTMIRRLKCAIR